MLFEHRSCRNPREISHSALSSEIVDKELWKWNSKSVYNRWKSKRNNNVGLGEMGKGRFKPTINMFFSCTVQHGLLSLVQCPVRLSVMICFLLAMTTLKMLWNERRLRILVSRAWAHPFINALIPAWWTRINVNYVRLLDKFKLIISLTLNMPGFLESSTAGEGGGIYLPLCNFPIWRPMTMKFHGSQSPVYFLTFSRPTLRHQ